MLYVWYNPKKQSYYIKQQSNYIINKLKVGDKNYYGHILICMFYIEGGTVYKLKLKQCNSYEEYKENNKRLKKLKKDFEKYDYVERYNNKEI